MREIDFRNLANIGLRNLVPYQPGKPVEELERELGIRSSIKLASNENPLGASYAVKKVMCEACEQAHIYPDGSAFMLKKVIAQFTELAPDRITVGNGSENILELIIKAYLEKGHTAIISEYTFLTIPILLKSYNITTKVIPTKQFRQDVDAILAAIDASTRVIFLVNPNNPTGTFTTADEFDKLIRQMPKNILLVVDEAYFEYITDANYPDTKAYLKAHPNLIITRTFSKGYGLAGIRLGYALSSPETADILNRARLPFNVNVIALKAGVAALHDEDHIKKSQQFAQAGLRHLSAALTKLNFSFIPSVGNFITINVGNGQTIYQKLLREGIIVRPLDAYGLTAFIRVTIGTEEQNERFLTALEKVRLST